MTLTQDFLIYIIIIIIYVILYKHNRVCYRILYENKPITEYNK